MQHYGCFAHYLITAFLSSSNLFQSLKETNRTFSSILKYYSLSWTLRRAPCTKELGKGHLYILPAATAEKGLRCLHLRAQHRSEQKVLEHLLKQTARGHIQGSICKTDGSKERELSKDAGYNCLLWLPTQHPLRSGNSIRMQFHWLF